MPGPELSSGGDFVYIGCYTEGEGGDGAGISLAWRDPSGALGPANLVVATPSPSFLARHPTLPVLYAVNELTEGALSAFEMAPDGGLTALGSWPTGGVWPCHLSIGDGHVYVANYGTGSVAVFPLDAAGVPTGRSDLVSHTGHGPDPQRQDGPHAHMVSPVDGGVLVIDLGIDAVLSYRLDPATGTLGAATAVATLPGGAGPRHLVRDLAGRVHVIGELDATVVTYEVTGDDGWREVARAASTVEPGLNQPSEIDISPDGRFLYVGNRGPDTVAVFALDSGTPRRVGEVSTRGAWPRHFITHADLLYVANERSNTVVTFRCDPATGIPQPIADPLSTASPTCVLPI